MLDAEMILDQKRSPGLIDEHAVMDQRIAVGLVENPCCWALEALAAHVPGDQSAIEIGAYRGRTTGWLALGAQGGNRAHVYSIDPWTSGSIPTGYADLSPSVSTYNASETKAAYDAHLKETGAASFVTPIQATAVEAAKTYDGPPVGLILHDGLHRAQDVAADLRAWIKHTADDAVIVLHDTDDARLGVSEGAARVLATKANAEKWAWNGRVVHSWAKNAGKAPEQRRRGFTVVYTRASSYPQLSAPITGRICK